MQIPSWKKKSFSFSLLFIYFPFNWISLWWLNLSLVSIIKSSLKLWLLSRTKSERGSALMSTLSSWVTDVVHIPQSRKSHEEYKYYRNYLFNKIVGVSIFTGNWSYNRLQAFSYNMCFSFPDWFWSKQILFSTFHHFYSFKVYRIANAQVYTIFFAFIFVFPRWYFATHFTNVCIWWHKTSLP